MRSSPGRFNEAAVLQPRRGTGQYKYVPTQAGFNEAAVLQPRRDRLVERIDRRVAASMRPRFFNHGELRRQRRSPRVVRLASMRPRIFNRGEAVSRRRSGGRGHASRRPRFFNRGEGAPAKYSVLNRFRAQSRAPPTRSPNRPCAGEHHSTETFSHQQLAPFERGCGRARHLAARAAHRVSNPAYRGTSPVTTRASIRACISRIRR